MPLKMNFGISVRSEVPTSKAAIQTRPATRPVSRPRTPNLPLKAVVVFTSDGKSAGLLAEHRPKAPILAVTSDVRVARRLALEWGVIPRLEVPPETLDETLRIATSLLVREKLCNTGEAFAMVVSWPTSGRTNTLKLHRL